MYVHVPEIQTNGSSALYLLRDAWKADIFPHTLNTIIIIIILYV